MQLALVGSAVTLLATSVGALPIFLTRRISERTQDVLMGFSAGVMLAQEATAGLMAGFVLMMFLDTSLG